MKHLLTVTLAILAALTFANAQPASAAPESPKFALLVGITDYSRDGIPKLQGCLNDVRDMRQELIDSYGFKPENIRVLTNAEATRDGIVQAFRAQLHDNAAKAPKGTFLFYYSGHGFQADDLNGDEKLEDPNDTKDETFMVWDMDLVDDDVDTLCRETRGVKDFTGSLTVILDSCHSGSATRGGPDEGQPHVKSPGESYVPQLGTPLNALPIQGNSNAGNFVAFSGSLSSQSSVEKLFPVAQEGAKGPEKNEYHGVLTYYLLQTMKTATQSTTNSQVWTQVATVLSGKYDQLPGLEGGGPRQFFLDGATRPTVPPIPYTLVGDTLTFPKGVEAGAVKGGFIKVSGQDKTEKQLTISAAKLGEATATLPAGTTVPVTGTVELLTPYFGSEPLKVGLGDGIATDNPVVKRLREHYTGDAGNFVRLAQDGETPGVFLARSTRGVARPGFFDTKAENQDEKGYILSTAPNGQPIFNFFTPATAGSDDISSAQEIRLFDTLGNFATQSNVKALNNQIEGGLTLTDSVEIKTIALNGSFNDKGKWFPDKANRGEHEIDLSKEKLEVGQGVRFEFQNKTADPLYVSALWLSGDGSITVLEGSKRQSPIVLDVAGKPESSARTGNYGITSDSGSETVKFFVSRQPINVAYLNRVAVRGAEKGVPFPFDMIAGQMMGTRAPSPHFDQPEFESWGTLSLFLDISNSPLAIANNKGFIDVSK